MQNPENTQPVKKSWKRKFFLIYAGQVVSLVGSNAVQFSLIWWLSSETGSALILSLAGLLAYLPQLFLGPFAGVWVDRLKRKTVIMCADLFTGLVAAVFAAMFFWGKPPYWTACVVLGVRAIGGVFHTPAIQAAIPMLVPKEELTRANGWSQFLQSGALLLGPVIGSTMYAIFPLPIILLSDLVGALAAIATVLPVRIPELMRKQQERPHFFREIKEGASIFLHDRRLSIVTVTMGLSMIFFLPLANLYQLMISKYFNATAWHASLVQVAYAVGMFAGAMTAGSLGKVKNKLYLVLYGIGATGIVTLLCGTLPPTVLGYWVFTVLCFALGGCVNFYNIPFTAYLQESIPLETQGRAFSLMGSMLSLIMPIGLILAGPISEAFSVSLWFLVAGIIICLISLSSLFLLIVKRKTI